MPAGLLAVAFGPAYTYMLLRVVYGQQWSETEAPRALAVYCLYILLLAVNGILEAFVHAVADSRCAHSLPALPVWHILSIDICNCRLRCVAFTI